MDAINILPTVFNTCVPITCKVAGILGSSDANINEIYSILLLVIHLLLTYCIYDVVVLDSINTFEQS